MTHDGAKRTRQVFLLPHMKFECGRLLTNLPLVYETWGALNSTRDNAILVAHSLTGDSHAASSPENPEPGWWEFMIGPGRAFDTDKYFVICSNCLGGCSGSAGPATIDPETGRPFALTFPTLTIRDLVRAQKQLLDHLGVRGLVTVSGGSMGGMQALEWAAQFPDFVASIIPIAAPGRAYPQSVAYRKAQRKAIMNDPDWRDGNYYGKSAPAAGIETARMLGFITYRTEKEFAVRFGRRFADGEYHSLHGRFEIEEYLEYHGKKLASWFDANTYLYLSKAMDLHDLGYGCNSYEAGVRRITCPTLMIGFDSDILFPSYQQREVVDILQQTNQRARFEQLHTIYGHDAFLLEKEQLTTTISEFLTTVNSELEVLS